MRSRTGFADFVATQSVALMRTAWLLTGNAHDADDLVQETLTRLYVKWPRVESARQPLAYARTAMVRCHISGRRLGRASETPIADLPESIAPEVDSDTRIVLSQALATLSPIDRAVLVLRYYEGRPAPEVAAALRLTPGAVRQRASRALATIRSQLPDDSDVAAGEGKHVDS